MGKNRRGRLFSGNVSAQAMVEFVLVLPSVLLLFCGIAQFAIICVNSIMINYAAYAVARAYVSYPSDSRSAQSASDANAVTQLMVDYTMKKNPKYKDLLAEPYSAMPSRTPAAVETVVFPDSDYVHDRVTVYYDLPLAVPVANLVFASLNKFKKNADGFFFITLQGTAIMNSGIKK